MDDGLLAVYTHRVLSEIITPSRQEMMDGPCLQLWKQVSQGHGSPGRAVLHSGRRKTAQFHTFKP